MVDFGKAEGALNSAVAAGFTDYQVIYENQGSSDGTPVEYEDDSLTVNFLPDAITAIEVGSNGRERATGVYQIDIRIPLFSGKYQMYVLLARIQTIFAKGTILTNETTKVRVLRTSPGPALEEGPKYRMPVSVYWQCDQ